jgi:hypothetical protein
MSIKVFLKMKILEMNKNGRILLGILIFGCLLSTAGRVARADPFLDEKLGLNGRTYPIGVQAIGSIGVNEALWGDTKSWQYGYLRGAFNASTSAVINRGGFELQFFPISILGFSAGYDWGYRSYTPKYLDCNLHECSGRVDRAYLKANFVAGYDRYIVVANARYDHLHAFDTAKPTFFDEMTLLVGRSSGERVMTWNPVLLYTIDPQWKVGVTTIYSHAIDTGDYSNLYGPIANYAWNPKINLLGGLGLNRSPVVESGWAAFFVFQYTLDPSLSIADLQAR